MKETKLNKPRSARSIATTLAIAFFTLSVVILLVYGILALFTNIQTNQDATSSKQQLIAQDAAKTVSQFIQDKFSSMETAVELVDLVSVSAETQKTMMESLLGHDLVFQKFVLFDTRGQQLAYVSRVSQALAAQFIAQLKDPFIQTSKSQRYISPVYIDNETGEPLMAIAIPIKNALGDLQGALVAEVNLKFMWELVDHLKVGQTGYVYVVDSKGNLLAFGDTSRVLRGESVQQIPVVKEFIQNLSASTAISPQVASYTGLLGTTVVGAYVPLDTPQWAVVTELPTAEAYQPVAVVMVVSIITILILAALAGIVGVFMARRLAVPLVNLTETATRIAGGEMELKTTVSGPREVVSLATAFNSMTAQLHDLIDSLEQRVEDRTRALSRQAFQLQAATEVSRAVSSVLDADELIQQAVNLVRDRFDLYYVGLFLLDEQHRFAVLEAGTGEAGRQMRTNAHRLEVGDDSMIGWCITHEQARIALDVGKEAVRFNNPLLPDTHSELALPLISQGQVIGAMTVQSEQESAFTQEDITILQTMADQLANGIEKARLYEQVQQRSAELTRQQYILDTFMDNIPDRIYFKDTQSRMTQANKAYAIRTGVQDFSELIGKNDFDFYPLDQAEIKYQQEQEIIKTGQPILGLEEPDGIDRWALTTKMPLRDEKGDIIGTFGISSDITELVKAKQAVESRARELEQAYETLQKQQQVLLITEKMASLGRLTAGIAHEMNTPLAAVRAALVNVEELAKEYQASIGDASITDEDHREIARELHSAAQLAEKAAERATGFVRGIKSQTRSPATQEHQPINAVVAVEDALLLLSHALRQGKCELDFKKSDAEIRLVGVPGRLEQVVTNLVNNAIDASYPQGGAITVSLNKHSEFVELQVSDHGSGILPENLLKIFDPMFSTKPFGSSTGLGLTIVHDITVEEFGGSIDVSSKPGQGATFTIRLPLRK